MRRLAKITMTRVFVATLVMCLLLSLALAVLAGRETFLVILFTSVAGMGVVSTLVFFVFTRLVYLPIKEIEVIENDPLGIETKVTYPKWGLRSVRFVTQLYQDYRLQREAYSRLSEAYRGLSLSESERSSASGENERQRISKLLRIPVDHKLAQDVSVYRYSQKSEELQLVAHSLMTHRSSAAAPNPLTATALAAPVEKAIANSEQEISLGGELVLLIPQGMTSKQEYLLIRVNPRKLWSRKPKIFRRFFLTLGNLLTDIPHQPQQGQTTPDVVSGQDLSRVYVEPHPNPPDTAGVITTPDWIGYCHRPASGICGDFLALAYDAEKRKSVVVMGDVPGQDLMSGLAASGTIAVISERLENWRLSRPEDLLQGLAMAVHRYNHSVFKAQLGVSLSALHFDHTTGNGLLTSFAQPFPYVIAPNDRKPMVVAPLGQEQGLLGLGNVQSFEPTPFTVLSGQVLMATTRGVLSLKDKNNRSFEREVRRGKLTQLFEEQSGEVVRDLPRDLIELALSHRGQDAVADDLTAVCFATIRQV